MRQKNVGQEKDLEKGTKGAVKKVEQEKN